MNTSILRVAKTIDITCTGEGWADAIICILYTKRLSFEEVESFPLSSSLETFNVYRNEEFSIPERSQTYQEAGQDTSNFWSLSPFWEPSSEPTSLDKLPLMGSDTFIWSPSIKTPNWQGTENLVRGSRSLSYPFWWPGQLCCRPWHNQSLKKIVTRKEKEGGVGNLSQMLNIQKR